MSYPGNEDKSQGASNQPRNQQKRDDGQKGPPGPSKVSSPPNSQKKKSSGSGTDRQTRDGEIKPGAGQTKSTRQSSGSGQKHNRSHQNRSQSQARGDQMSISETKPNQPRVETVRKNQKSGQKRQNQQTRASRVGKTIEPEETYEDIKKDIERIEKEIWLEIAGLHTIKLD